MKIEELLNSTALTELRMSPSSLRAMAARIPGALVGMEFEMYVPNVEGGGSDDIELDYDEDNYIDASSYRSFQKSVLDFFTGGDFGDSPNQIKRRLESADEEYFEWADSKFYEWAREGNFEEWYREENPDKEDLPREGSNGWNNAMDEFRDEKFDEFVSDEASINSWLEAEGIDRFSTFADRYDLSWPYLRTAGTGTESLEAVASDFESAVGIDCDVHTEYHQARKSTTKYTLEPDGSLDSPESEEDRGLEFVSPPLTIDQMIEQLTKVKRWAGMYGAYTNKSTGLHINVSVPNFDFEKLDYVKLALFVGDDWVANQFNRLGTSWCKSSLEQIKQNVKTDPDKIPGYLEAMRKGLSKLASRLIHSGQTDKYVSLNTKDNRVEFRAPGGDWLDSDLDKVINTMLRFVVALDIAMDPEKEKREYATKMYKLIDGAKVIEDTDTIKYFAQYSARELPKAALKSFLRQAVEKRKGKKSEGTEYIITAYGTDGKEFDVPVNATSRREAVEKFRKEYLDTEYSIKSITGDQYS